MNYFVTRHPGALDWLKNTNPKMAKSAQAVSHFDVNVVTSGDTVIGVLPVNLAEAVCAAGAKFIALQMTLPPALRGKELTAKDMVDCGATLQEYRIVKVSE